MSADKGGIQNVYGSVSVHVRRKHLSFIKGKQTCGIAAHIVSVNGIHFAVAVDVAVAVCGNFFAFVIIAVCAAAAFFACFANCWFCIKRPFAKAVIACGNFFRIAVTAQSAGIGYAAFFGAGRFGNNAFVAVFAVVRYLYLKRKFGFPFKRVEQ